MAKEYLVTETYFGSRKVVVTYGEYTGEDFDPCDCDGSADVYKSVVTGTAGVAAHLKEIGPCLDGWDVDVYATLKGCLD